MEMLTWNDIVIIGDSFCYHRTEAESWPKKLALQLTNDSTTVSRGLGYPGGSWWAARKRLLNELSISVPKILIMCHTEPNRLPNYYDFSLNGASIFDNSPGNDYAFVSHGDIDACTWNFLNGKLTDFGPWEMPKLHKQVHITKEQIDAVKQYFLHLTFPT